MNEKYPYLDEALINYIKTDYYPFHMPGHKRRALSNYAPEAYDITEIDGFDNLHHATGILKEAQARMAGLCGADASFYLVNGSTAGILAAICGSVRKNDRILIARNCHKSVYHAVYLMELTAEYLYPAPAAFGIQGSILPGQVADMLERFPDIRAVVITSPTYDGVVSDIAAIADIVHARQIPLIVDEAHGAHFGFSDGFPQKALALGADLCIESLHKTLPSYTQTAVLHCKGTIADIPRIQRYLGIYQTSSPSYVFMAGMDRCARILAGRTDLFASFEARLRAFYRESESWENIALLRESRALDELHASPAIFDHDFSKILITDRTATLTGPALYDTLLHDYHLQMEMESGHYVTAITTIMDTDEGFARLTAALGEIDAHITRLRQDAAALTDKKSPDIEPECNPLKGTHSPIARLTPAEIYRAPERECTIAEAMDAPWERIALKDAADHISAEFLYLYPPGIPILAPGEYIGPDLLQTILRCRDEGLSLQGLSDLNGETICVCDADRKGCCLLSEK